MNYNILLDPVFESHVNRSNSLPYICHTDFTCGKRITNYHENLEFLYFLDGCGTVQINNTAYNVTAGDLMVVNSYCLHQVSSSEPIRYFCLIIDNGFCKYHHIDCCQLYFTEQIHDPIIASLMQEIMEESKGSKAYFELGMQAAILSLLLALCRNYIKSTKQENNGQYAVNHGLQAAVFYIKDHLSEKMTIQEVAQSAGLSQYHFMRQFKQLTGLTVATYINLLRCEYAKSLLISEKYTLKEIAYMCGFDTDGYFCTVFKKHTGMSPSGYLSSILQHK